MRRVPACAPSQTLSQTNDWSCPSISSVKVGALQQSVPEALGPAAGGGGQCPEGAQHQPALRQLIVHQGLAQLSVEVVDEGVQKVSHGRGSWTATESVTGAEVRRGPEREKDGERELEETRFRVQEIRGRGRRPFPAAAVLHSP